jgi:FeS assembly SUF system protein
MVENNLRDLVVSALQRVCDPEIQINVYDLGLIYRLDVDEATGKIDIEMTLTTPSCPVAGLIPEMVTEAVNRIGQVKVCHVRLVWEPRWNPSMMSKDAQLAFNI